MSRVYFHSPSGTAELAGAERAWLGHLACGPAEAAWGLDPYSDGGFERSCAILATVDEVPEGNYGANYLHRYLREAQEQERRNHAVYASLKPGQSPFTGRTDHEPMRRLVSSLQTVMRVGGLTMIVSGVRLHSRNVDLNTALVAGSDQIALAAKIHGWCEDHAWVEGSDRAWLADLVEHGLDTGLYRRGMGWDQPRQYDQGPGVVPLLRSRDDEPVVMSYSVTDSFPDSAVGDWMPSWPEGVPRKWEALTEDQEGERSRREEEWCDLPADRQWEISLAGLRGDRPWARISADTLRTVTFHLPVKVYDLIGSDREDRIRAKLADHPDYCEMALASTTTNAGERS